MTATMAPPARCVHLVSGRTVSFDEMSSSSALQLLQRLGLTFKTPEELARWIGHHYGWRTTLPTSVSGDCDSMLWWLLNDFYLLGRGDEAHDGSAGWFDLVPTLRVMTDGDHATLTIVALQAAGLATVIAEDVGSAQ